MPDEKKQREHIDIERKLWHKMAAVLADQQLSEMGRKMLQGIHGPQLFHRTQKAPRSGWVYASSSLELDKLGCARGMRLRFLRTENGEIKEMTRRIVVMADGRAVEVGNEADDG